MLAVPLAWMHPCLRLGAWRGSDYKSEEVTALAERFTNAQFETIDAFDYDFRDELTADKLVSYQKQS
jgi:hypothetical protein